MADPIDLEVRIAGVEAAVRGVEGLTSSLVEESRAAQGATRATNTTEESFADLVRGGQSVIQRIQGVASAVQSLVSQLGSSDRTAGLVASIAGTTAQFASMGAMLGPGGAVVGGIIGLGTSLYGLVTAHDDAAEAARNQAGALDDVSESVRGLGEVMLEWRDVLGIEGAVRAGGEALGDLSESALASELRTREARLMELRVANAETGALVRSEEEIRLRREVEGLEAEIRRRDADDSTPSRGGRRAPAEETVLGAAMTEDALAEFTSINSDEELARRAEADAEYAAQAEELANAEIERLAREGDAQAELFALKEELRQQDLESEREKQDYLRELEEQAAEAREQELDGLMQMVGRSSKAIFTAIAQVASGAKSGEEAFLGLLKSFLEMISEYAALKAATEFADAAASFARYDFGGGAAHVGAGLAFTAVAVATGVGAAAIGTGAPQAPARPEAQPAAEGGGGNTSYVINWNSPVVTAGTRAELGRDLMGLMSEAEAA